MIKPEQDFNTVDLQNKEVIFSARTHFEMHN